MHEGHEENIDFPFVYFVPFFVYFVLFILSSIGHA